MERDSATFCTASQRRGVVGLRFDEMPAILERGEEVLPETDWCHRNNMRGRRAGMTIYAPVTVNAQDGESVLKSRGMIRRQISQAWRQAQRDI